MDPESPEDLGAEHLGAEQMSQWLDAWASHDADARDRLVPIVYAELRRLAHHYVLGGAGTVSGNSRRLGHR